MADYESRRDTITMHAWETWTKNGLRMDAEMRAETEKSVRDAVNNCYVEGISNADWLAATLKRLGVSQ